MKLFLGAALELASVYIPGTVGWVVSGIGVTLMLLYLIEDDA